MSDTYSAILGIVILAAIGLVAWRLARQARRRSEGAYASEISGMAVHPDRAGMSVMDQTLVHQHLPIKVTGNGASHGGDGLS